eukprot:scaffold3600_cov387-Prasinococcus_capsulatus_cf.AAC.8
MEGPLHTGHPQGVYDNPNPAAKTCGTGTPRVHETVPITGTFVQDRLCQSITARTIANEILRDRTWLAT